MFSILSFSFSSVHKRFGELAPEKMKSHGRNPVLSKEEILALPELAVSCLYATSDPGQAIVL